MKKLILLVVCASIGLSGWTQIKKTVRAEGKIVKSERSAGSFTGVSTASAIDIILTQGNTHSITVEAEENLHDYIVTKVVDGVLKVYSEANIKDSKSMKVYVTMKEIRSLSASSAGDITVTNKISVNDIELNSSSAGDITVALNAKKITSNSSSAGDITLSGKADYLKATAKSSGDLEAIDLEVKDAELSASSSGDIEVTVTGKLTASASSSGNIHYKGNPEVIKSSSGLGSIKKK